MDRHRPRVVRHMRWTIDEQTRERICLIAKASTDPDFLTKMQTIPDLYDRPPVDGRAVCVDEFGPLDLQPHKGKCWRPETRPHRQRATYHRYDGVMRMLAALDLAGGGMYRPRTRSREFLDLLKVLRGRWPRENLYVVLDNLSPHRDSNVRAWSAANDVELMFLPTYGSWPSWIESAFAALRYFASKGTDHRSGEQTRPSPCTCAGATPTPRRRPASRLTHRSGRGLSTRITQPTLPDEPLARGERLWALTFLGHRPF
ncbi:transposase [Rhodococcus triatomae]